MVKGNGETKTRNIPPLTRKVRRYNSLLAKRAKFAELDAEIKALGAEIAAELGVSVENVAGAALEAAE